MADSNCSLLCQEDFDCCLNDTTNFDVNEFCLVFDSDHLEILFRKEATCFRSSDNLVSLPTKPSSWLRFARLDSIHWILNTKEVFGFKLETAYIAISYFDRFLSKRSIEEGKLWATRLLSVACLSLAAKMEECNVPPLSEFTVEDYCFECIVIQRMELMVLSALDWKLCSITPFPFLNYFIDEICHKSKPKDVFFRSVEYVLAAVKEIELLDYRPSVIALAAVFAASSNSQLTRDELDLKINLISSWNSLQNEQTYSCYVTMCEILIGKSKTPSQKISLQKSPKQLNSIDVSVNSNLTTGAETKRSLKFIETDQHHVKAKKIHRQN